MSCCADLQLCENSTCVLHTSKDDCSNNNVPIWFFQHMWKWLKSGEGGRSEWNLGSSWFLPAWIKYWKDRETVVSFPLRKHCIQLIRPYIYSLHMFPFICALMLYCQSTLMMQEGGKHLTQLRMYLCFQWARASKVCEYKSSDHSQTRTKSVLPWDIKKQASAFKNRPTARSANKRFFSPKWIKITLFVACSKIILTHASDHKCIYYQWDQIAEWKSFKLNVIMGTLRWRLCTYSSHGGSPKDPILASACQRTNQTLVLALIRPEGQSAPQRNSGESSPITTSQCFWDPAKTRLYICI